MNGFGNWLRRFSMKASYNLRRFMEGRYGTDRLNTAILTAGVVVCILSSLFSVPLVKLVLTLISYALMFWAIGRTLSRNLSLIHI